MAENIKGAEKSEIRRSTIILKQVCFSAGDLSLQVDVKQASKDSSTGNTGSETQQSCKELTMVSSPVVIVSHNSDVKSSEAKAKDAVKLKTFHYSKNGDINCKNNNNNSINNNNNNNNNNNRRGDRGSLSLVTSNGSVNDLSLMLPFGIGLDCPPCRKRAASSPELDENHFPEDQSFKAKKIKRLSLSDEDVKTIHPRFQDVTRHTQSVSQDGALDGSELNEENKGTNKLNLKSDAANTSRSDERDILNRKEFSLGDTKCVTVFNRAHIAQGISAVEKRWYHRNRS